MAKRRANGEGSLYQRSNGLWAGRLTYDDLETGDRKRIAVYGKTQREVRAKMKAARERLDAGAPPKDSTRTVGDWVEHWRETTLKASSRKGSTKGNYADMARGHIEPPPFGAITLAKLKPTDIEKLIIQLRDDDKLSDSTIRNVFAVLSLALNGAVRDGLLARNPAAQVKRPGVKRKEARHLDAKEVAAVLKAAESSRYHSALVLAAVTGMRRGELCALKWDAVDLDGGSLNVVATVARIGGQLTFSEPKSERSRRTIPLAPATVALLKKHRKTQLEDRMRAANLWTDNDLVFPTEFGTPLDPRNLLRVVERAAAKAKVKDVGTHTLRHSAATSWLEAGVHIKAVSDLLGHSSISVTGDIYGHVSDDTARAAVLGLTKSLGV